MKRNFPASTHQQVDLLVCGGGIYGAWTAYDAALRGLKVMIVEQGDWAGATSSASSKLIHGGLRYLETYDFKLVSKALKEREMLLRTAPHRVWPLRFGVPVYSRQRINRLQLKCGLIIYDFLAGGSHLHKHHAYLSRKQFSEHFGFLADNTLKGGFTYGDAQTDDARLVLELIAGAMDVGAYCINYCKLTQLLESNGSASGAIIQDQLSQTEQIIHAKQIVFTTGQWLANDTYSQNLCRLAKGVHLIMPPVLNEEALLLTARSDGRVFFLIPWYGLTLLGTTDTDFNGDVEHTTVDESDIDYLLSAVNDYLKSPWTRSDVIGSFAGVRVFKQSTLVDVADPPSAVSRDWELKSAPNGVHYAIGGKITSSRPDAARIVDAVCEKLGISTSCATQDRLFPWAPPEDFPTWFSRMHNRALQLGIDAESAQWLLRRHGVHSEKILSNIATDANLTQRIVPSLPFIYADLMYCAAAEMVIHLDDLLRRRLPILILAKLTSDQLFHIAEHVAATLEWNDTRLHQEIERCRRQWTLA